MSMRSAASCAQPLQLRTGPRGARTTRVPAPAPGVSIAIESSDGPGPNRASGPVCAGSLGTSHGGIVTRRRRTRPLRNRAHQLAAQTPRAQILRRYEQAVRDPHGVCDHSAFACRDIDGPVGNRLLLDRRHAVGSRADTLVVLVSPVRVEVVRLGLRTKLLLSKLPAQVGGNPIVESAATEVQDLGNADLPASFAG